MLLIYKVLVNRLVANFMSISNFIIGRTYFANYVGFSLSLLGQELTYEAIDCEPGRVTCIFGRKFIFNAFG